MHLSHILKIINLNFHFFQSGFINRLRFSDDGEEVVCAVGQEHKFGRWWKIAEAKNVITVFSLTYDAVE